MLNDPSDNLTRLQPSVFFYSETQSFQTDVAQITACTAIVSILCNLASYEHKITEGTPGVWDSENVLGTMKNIIIAIYKRFRRIGWTASSNTVSKGMQTPLRHIVRLNAFNS